MAETGQLQGGSQDVKVPILESIPESIPKKYLELLSEDIAKKNKMVIFGGGEGVLKIAMVDPTDPGALNVLGFIAGKEDYEVDKYLVSEDDFEELMGNYETAEKAIEDVVQSFEVEKKEAEKKKRVVMPLKGGLVTFTLSLVVKGIVLGIG
jgi:hypothetical protein